jgi:hypothetical protein
MQELHSILAGKWEDGTRPKDLFAEKLSKRPAEYVGALLAGLVAKEKRVVAGCAELISLCSVEAPELFYPHAERFLQNLHAKAPILRWEAVCTIGNLARVDAQHKLKEAIGELLPLLSHKSIVLQSHTAHALGKLGAVYPEQAPRILAAFADSVEHFPGTRVGLLLEATAPLTTVPTLHNALRAFVTPYADSALRPVAQKAKRLLRRLDAK